MKRQSQHLRVGPLSVLSNTTSLFNQVQKLIIHEGIKKLVKDDPQICNQCFYHARSCLSQVKICSWVFIQGDHEEHDEDKSMTLEPIFHPDQWYNCCVGFHTTLDFVSFSVDDRSASIALATNLTIDTLATECAFAIAKTIIRKNNQNNPG